MSFEDWIELIARILSVVGVGTMLAGIALAAGGCGRSRRAPCAASALPQGRRRIGRAILLGLELLVAADIIRTVVAPTFRSAGVLGLIVLIRTFLSFALEVELEGRWPWRAGGERTPS